MENYIEALNVYIRNIRKNKGINSSSFIAFYKSKKPAFLKAYTQYYIEVGLVSDSKNIISLFRSTVSSNNKNMGDEYYWNIVEQDTILKMIEFMNSYKGEQLIYNTYEGMEE